MTNSLLAPSSLFNLLEAAGIPKKDIASRLGVSKTLVTLWSQAKRSLSWAHYEALLDLVFDPETIISVEGDWQLRDATGNLLDASTDNYATHNGFRVQAILGKKVIAYSISPPESFSLQFESGHVLSFIDNLPNYESISIQPGNIFI